MAETRARKSTARKRAASTRRARETKPARAECSFVMCPICTALSAAQEVRPEAVQHLMAASRELLLAARTFIDARVRSSAGSSRLEKIDIA
jgi:hypothetical protein